MEKRICNSCGKVYTAQRTTSKYCSDTCRSRAHRRRHRLDPLVPNRPPDVSLASPGIIETVDEARKLANSFSRISSVGPRQIRAGASRVASAITNALDAEGW